MTAFLAIYNSRRNGTITLGTTNCPIKYASQAIWGNSEFAQKCFLGHFCSGRNSLKKLLLLLFVVIAGLAFGQETVPGTFFSMDLHCCGMIRGRQPWPTVPFGGMRLWDSGVMWLQINPSRGVYDWESLDGWLHVAETHHVDVLYTFGGIPSWASGDVEDPKCREWHTPGSCHPPSDLREDGSGTDQTWKDFVTAIAQHAHGRIKYWELWNEPHNLFFWNGTMAQMVRMAQDLRTITKSIDPEAVIVSPGTAWENLHPETGKPAWNGLIWTDQFLAAGGKNYIDVVATHGYLHGQCPGGSFDANQIEIRTGLVRSIMQKNGVANMPLWSTEGSWGPITKFCTADPSMQTAFVGQYYISAWVAGFKRVYWYAWNDTNVGALYDDPDPYRPRPAGEAYGQVFDGVRPAGQAYGEVYRWMVGTTAEGCKQTKSLTSCRFSRPNGAQYLAMWDSSQSCSDGNCSTVTVNVDPMYIDYLDLSGRKTTIRNTVPVGTKPIWLEAPPPGSSKKKQP